MPLRHAVKGLITRGDSVLLVLESGGEHSPFYSLPGGGVEQGESEAGALKRELQEEIAAAASVESYVASYVYSHRSQDVTSDYQVYECELVSDSLAPQAAEGILDAGWYSVDALPERCPSEIETIIRRAVCQSENRSKNSCKISESIE